MPQASRGDRPRPLRAVALVLMAGLALAAGAQAQECAPWPGEPARLLAHAGEDPWIARWRELRIAELSERARALERAAPVESHLLWRRIACLDPWNEDARAGALRTRPLQVHRPALVARAAPAPADPWQALDAPIPLAPANAPTRPGPASLARVGDAARERRLALVEGLLVAADSLLRAERFEEAGETVGQARRGLAALPDGPDLRAPRMRAELLGARAALALGRETAARGHLAAVRAIDPAFEPDPRELPPELLRAYRALAESAP